MSARNCNLSGPLCEGNFLDNLFAALGKRTDTSVAIHADELDDVESAHGTTSGNSVQNTVDESVQYTVDNSVQDTRMTTSASFQTSQTAESNHSTQRKGAAALLAGAAGGLMKVLKEEDPSTAEREESGEDATARDNNATAETEAGQEIKAVVHMISGCQDKQTSADVSNISSFQLPDPQGRAGGACTAALLQVLYDDEKRPSKDYTFVEVLNKMRYILKRKRFSQIPQLTSSVPVDVDEDFYLVPPNCTGTRRAVLIGINYIGQQGQLSGCHNDVLNMKKYIMDVWDFEEENILILMDDGYHRLPTRENILAAYKSVAVASQSGDAVFAHYSGHGGRVRDDDWGEEKDGYDETLIPIDYVSAGQIRDDDLNKTLVCAMEEGVHLVSLMDCCHSGTVLDLPYKYQSTSSGSSGSSSTSTAMKWGCTGGTWLIIVAVIVVLSLHFTIGLF